VVGSIAFWTGQAQAGIIGQLTGVEAGVQAGHFSIGQQLTGSLPAVTGSSPPGQATTYIGQATGGLVASHGDGAGLHRALQVCPVQLPAASQPQAGAAAGHEHKPPARLPWQAQVKQVSVHCSPAGQSELDAQGEFSG